MPAWRDDKILELAGQLTYSPADKRRVQLCAAVDLLPAIDPAKSYPWDFVYFRITNIQTRSHIDHVISGKVLRADLSSLIEFLSDTLSIPVEQAAASGDAVLEFEEVSRKFNVSSKTIQRWRKQGLPALKYLYPDGRRRLGFLESAVACFAAANKERVEKSAAFRQLSDEEKSRIIELARRMASQTRASIKEISRSIGHVMNRSPETIRYTLRRYDRDHPEAAIFSDTGPLSELRRPAENISPVPAADAPPIAAGESPTPAENAAHLAADISATLPEIEFIPNPLFEHPDADHIILKLLPAEAFAKAQASVAAGANAKSADVYMARMPQNLPPFLQEIFRQPVMPQELETDAFRRMNFLKYRAHQLQIQQFASLGDSSQSPSQSSQCPPLTCGGRQPPSPAENPLEEQNPNETDLPRQITKLLTQAADLKNQILKSNLRVAVHVARKHQRIDRPLMELISDATIWLMRAIEKFDFARGASGAGDPTAGIAATAPSHAARFSTYASYAIMKNFARNRAEALTRRESNVLTGQQEILNALGDRSAADSPAEHLDAAGLQSDLLALVQELPERERELLIRHYGLDQKNPPLSLAQISGQMGITKARVRQIESRALFRLRGLLETRRATLQKAATRTRSLGGASPPDPHQ